MKFDNFSRYGIELKRLSKDELEMLCSWRNDPRVGVFMAWQKELKSAYFRAFPYALALCPKLFVITLSWIKLTNNALGKKIIWEKK